MNHGTLVTLLGLVALISPVMLLCILGVASLAGRKLSEVTTGRFCQMTNVIGLAAVLFVLALMLPQEKPYESIDLGKWVDVGAYEFKVKLVFDRLSVPFIILTFLLCGVIAAFATRYLHREAGFNRFFVLYSLFVVGMVLTSLAGTIETLFAGWEMVGLSSTLLVAFYQDRPAPARNGLRVWIVYRVSDAALLLAAIFMHHLRGEGDFSKLLGGGEPWPSGGVVVSGGSVIVVGLLLIVAAAGKSALVPFSGWLPRAMEGPTPSSAIFYGALSVHLGAYLLLRVSPLLETSYWLSGIVVALGLMTAVYAWIVGNVQTDIKSALAFASLVQVGIIVAEIGLGFQYLALIHLLGNACLRTLQFLRAPTLLHDYHLLEDALGEHLPHAAGPLPSMPGRFRRWVYRFALERGYLDAMLDICLSSPFVRLFRYCDGLERRWTDMLTGGRSREAEEVSEEMPMSPRAIEDLP